MPRSGASLSLPGSGLMGAAPARSAEIVVSLENVLCGYPAADGEAARAHRACRPARGTAVATASGWSVPTVPASPRCCGRSPGELPALEGFVRMGKNVMPGYLSQLRDRPLGGLNVLDALTAVAPVTPGAARSYLARFLFRGDDVLKPVSELSGGERSRLELALLGVGAVNLLLLDEPTNHLDISAREALEAFLRESEATLIIVSHDRRLLESTCDRLWVVEPVGLRGAGPGGALRPRLPRVAGRGGRRLDGGRGRWRGQPVRLSAPAPRQTGRAEAVSRPRGRRHEGGRPRLSKDAYRREHERIEADMDAAGRAQGRAGGRRSRIPACSPTSSSCAALAASWPTSTAPSARPRTHG